MNANKLMLLTAEQVAELAETTHGLRLLAKIADAIDEYLSIEALNAVAMQMSAVVTTSGISMDELANAFASTSIE